MVLFAYSVTFFRGCHLKKICFLDFGNGAFNVAIEFQYWCVAWFTVNTTNVSYHADGTHVHLRR